jgi:hypothetical protein
VPAKDGASAYIARERHHFRKNRTIEQGRVSARAIVHRYDDSGVGLFVAIDELIEGSGLNERLIGEDDEGGGWVMAERCEAERE